MNILHINTVIGRGGAGKVVEQLMEYQKELGHYSSAILAWDYKQSNSRNIEIISSAQEPNYYWPDYHINKSFDVLNSTLFKEADIVHIHNIHGNYFNPLTLIPICLSKPTIWTLHDMDSITGHCTNSIDCNKWQTGCGNCPYLDLPKKLNYDNTANLWQAKQEIFEYISFSITTPSTWLLEISKKNQNKSKKHYHIPNPIDINEFSKISRKIALEHFNLNNSNIYIGLVSEGGLKNPYKGIKVFKEIITALNSKESEKKFVGLIIGGESDYEFSDNIIVLKRATNDKIRMSAFYSSLDFYLCTSIAENYPLSILEAMSLKIPVIGHEVGGVGELLKNNCGILVKQNSNYNEYVNNVNFLLENPDRVISITTNAFNSLKEKNINFISEQFIKVYKSTKINFKKLNPNKITLRKQPSIIISDYVIDILKKWRIKIITE